MNRRNLTLAHSANADPQREVPPGRQMYDAGAGGGYNYPSYAGSYNYGQSAAGTANEDELVVLLRKLWRQKWIILSSMVLGLILAFVVMSMMPRTYEGSAALMIEDTQPTLVGQTGIVRPAVTPYDDRSIKSQIDVLQSRRLAERVITQLNLTSYDEFNPGVREETWRDRMWSKIIELAGGGGMMPEAAKDSERVVTSAAVNKSTVPIAVVEAYLGRLDVNHKPQSRIIELGFKARSPELTAYVTNTLAELYIADQTETKFDESRRTTGWLDKEIATMRADLKVKEAEIEKVRQDAGLLTNGGGTVTGQQLSEINAQLIMARTQTAQARAKKRQVQSVADGAGGIVAAGEILGSPLIQSLREQKAEVDRRIAELSTEYGDKHPKMVTLYSESRDIDAQIESEAGNTMRDLDNEVEVAAAQERSLQTELDRLEAKLGASSSEEVKLRALQRETEADRNILNQMLSRLREAKAQENRNSSKADVKIISYADVPERPSSPKPAVILPLVLVASALFGLGLAFMLEQMEPGYISGQQVENEFGVPAITLIPATNRFSNLGGEPDILQEPRSPFAESIRTIAASIRLFDIDNPPRSVLITSSEPSEGKTTTAVSVARMQALAGLKVVIVDTDIRKPAVHERLAVRRAPGLVEVLDGKHTLDEVIVEDEKTGLHVIPVGVPMSTDILSLDSMQELLYHLSERYDLIILDSAPILAVSDARVLPAVADMTIFTCRWRNTRREVVRLAMKKLGEAGARVGGIVLSRVDVGRHSKYGYGDSGMFTGKNKKYYASGNQNV